MTFVTLIDEYNKARFSKRSTVEGETISMVSWIVLPFMSRGRLDVVLLGIFLLMNCMVFVNSYLHNPERVFDGYGHMAYVKVPSLQNDLEIRSDKVDFR